MIVEKGWFVPTIQFGPDDVFLIEDWDETPVGPYSAVFHFSPQDFRTLYASNERGRDLVSTIHRFDEKHVVEMESRHRDGCWTVEADTGEKGVLRIEIDYGETALLRMVNPALRFVPDLIARNPLYCKLVPKVAAPLMGTDPDQKMMGTTETGRGTRFRMQRIFVVAGASCSWGGRAVAPLTECRYRHDMGAYKTISKAMVSYLSLIVED